jgi:hypothetical protein
MRTTPRLAASKVHNAKQHLQWKTRSEDQHRRHQPLEAWPECEIRRFAKYSFGRLADAISEELQKLTDSQWAILAPYFGSSIWCASVSDVCRRVGFNHVHDLDSFIEELVDTFHAQAVTV